MKKLRAFIRPELVALLVLVGFESYLIASSNGFYYIDEGAHFVDDYLAVTHPSVSIGVWQRFGSVWIFALPAQFGAVAVKVFASLLFLLTIFVAYKVAELEQLPYREWLVVLVGFQPVLLDISFTCLAELPATLFLILAYYLYKKSAWRLSLLTASLVFLCRYEMSFLAVLIFLVALRKRRYAALPYALAGPVIWLAFSWILTGDPAWLLREFVKFGSIPKFIPGTSLDHYLRHSVDIFGTIPVWLAIASIAYAVYNRKMPLVIPFLTILWCIVFNTLASAQVFNWTPSVGDFRYLATVGPFVGLLSLDGLGRIMELLRKVPRSTFVPAILAIMMMYAGISAVKPHRLSSFEKAVITLSRRAASDTTSVPILSNHWASMYAVINDDDKIERIVDLRESTYLKFPKEYILWDSHIANSVFSQQTLTYQNLRLDPCVTLIDSLNVGYGWVSLLLRDTEPRGKLK